MRMSRRSIISVSTGIACGLTGAAFAAGPDVIVGDLYGVENFGAVGGIRAYSIATESCNVGDQDLLWQSWNNNHPVIAQHMYRLKDGRLEHLGQSWLKHGFTALTLNLCGTCNGHGGSVLGVGCSDPYSTGLNGQQSNLGPKSEVNATTGVFLYPYVLAWQQTGNAIYKRLQVPQVDLANSGALYFIEGQYVTQDDAAAGNKDNNASYRRVTISSSTYNVTLQGSTQRTRPAINAWYDHGLGVNTPDPRVKLLKKTDEDGGTFWVASKITDLGGGNYRYDYAVQNLNSHLCGGSFSVPIPPGTILSNIYFSAPFYHSGEPYDNTDWVVTEGGGAITWSSPQTYAQNVNSNALRWGSMYNFSFECSRAPENGTATLGLFKPADTPTLTLSVEVPGGTCAEDLDGDGSVGLGDLSVLLENFGSTGGPAEGDLDGDGDITLADLSDLLELFGLPCP